MKKPNPYISIIIANYNGRNYLKDCLGSLLKTSSGIEYEILVVDNNSTDESIEIISEFQKKNPRIRVLKNKVNRGVPFSRNKAIKEAKGEILVFLDNDTKVNNDWLKGITQIFLSDQSIGGLQCKIFDFKKTDLIQEVGMKIYPYTGFATPLGRSEKDHGQYDKPQEIIALGAASAVRKEVAKMINGFDLKLFYCTDDLDFSWRIWLAGFKVVLAPNSKVFHYTKNHNPGFKLYFHLSKNSLRMLIKNYQAYNLIKFLPLAILFNLAGGLYVMLSRGGLVAFFGVLSGFSWNLIHLADTLKERLKIQRLRRVTDKQIFDKIMVRGNLFSVYRNYFKIAKTSVRLMKDTL